MIASVLPAAAIAILRAFELSSSILRPPTFPTRARGRDEILVGRLRAELDRNRRRVMDTLRSSAARKTRLRWEQW